MYRRSGRARSITRSAPCIYLSRSAILDSTKAPGLIKKQGFAIGSQTLPIAIRKGVDPTGLLGKYQAMSGYDKTWDAIADEILGVLSARDDFQELKVDALIRAIRVSRNFNRYRTLLQSFQTTQALTARQEQDLVEAINGNVQINSSYVLEQMPNQLFLEQLRGLTGNEYEFVENPLLRPDAQSLRRLPF